MSNETKCMNSGCRNQRNEFSSETTYGCVLYPPESMKNCPCYNFIPTTSIPTAELAELRADREMLDWLTKFIKEELEDGCRGEISSFIDDVIENDDNLKTTILKAMKEPT